jgi:hypothetical protein
VGIAVRDRDDAPATERRPRPSGPVRPGPLPAGVGNRAFAAMVARRATQDDPSRDGPEAGARGLDDGLRAVLALGGGPLVAGEGPAAGAPEPGAPGHEPLLGEVQPDVPRAPDRGAPSQGEAASAGRDGGAPGAIAGLTEGLGAAVETGLGITTGVAGGPAGAGSEKATGAAEGVFEAAPSLGELVGETAGEAGTRAAPVEGPPGGPDEAAVPDPGPEGPTAGEATAAGPEGCGCEDCAECAGAAEEAPPVVARTATGAAPPARARRAIQRGLLDDIGDAASSAAHAVGGAASSAASAVGSAASSAASAVGDAASSVLPTGLLDQVSGLAGAARGRVASLAGMDGQAVDAEAQVRQQGEGAHQEAERQSERARQGSAQAQARAHESAARTEQETAEHRGHAEGAAGQMSGIGGLIGPALDPGGGLVDAPAVRQVAQRMAGVVGSLPGEAGEAAGELPGAVKGGLAAGPTGGWDCSSSEIMSMVSNMGDVVSRHVGNVGRRVLGEEGYARLVAFEDRISAGVRDAAAAVRRTAGQVAGRVSAWWQRTTAPIAARVQKVREGLARTWDGLQKGVKGWIDQRWKGLSAGWERLKTGVVSRLESAANGAKSFVSGAVERAKSVAGRFWSMLPGPVQGLVTGLGAAVVGPAALVIGAAQRLGAFVASHKDQILARLKEAGNAVARSVAKAYDGAKTMLSGVWAKVRQVGSTIAAAVRQKASALYAAADEASGGWLGKIRTSVAAIGPAIRDDVCAVLGTASAPCIKAALPKHGDFAEASLGGDLTVPVEGVPVKIAAGAKVTVTGDTANAPAGADRPTAQRYTAVIAGEGAISVAASLDGGGGGGSPGGGGGSKVGVSVDLPQGGKAKLWERITGGPAPATPAAGAKPGAPPAGGTAPASGGPAPASGGPAPASGGPAPTPGGTAPARPSTGGGPAPGGAPKPATPGGAPAPGAAPAGQQPAAPGGGSEMSAGVEAGLKGSAQATYAFSADGKDAASCRGLGGLTTLLAAGGASGAASQLPPPFGLVGSAGGSLTADAFADQLTSLQMTFAQFGGLTVDLKHEGVGSLKMAVSGERGVTLETAKEATGEQSVSASVFASLGGSIGGELGVGPLSGVGGSAGASGRIYATLKYMPARDVIQTIDAGASITASVSLNNIQTLLDALPAPVAAEARRQAEPYLGGAGNATVEGTAAFKVSNLQKLGAELDAYFANPDGVSLDGVYSRVSAHIAANNELAITVTLTARSRIVGVSVSAEQSGQSGTVGGNVSAALDVGQKLTLASITITNGKLPGK